MKLKHRIASLFIPKNSPYCHHRFKKDKHGRFYAKACIFHTHKWNKQYRYYAEYCRLNREFLSIDDQVKDCGINDDWRDEE